MVTNNSGNSKRALYRRGKESSTTNTKLKNGNIKKISEF